MTETILISWLLSLVTLAFGLMLAYVVIRYAVINAMKAHTTWATPENVAAARQRANDRAAAEEAARRSMWGYREPDDSRREGS